MTHQFPAQKFLKASSWISALSGWRVSSLLSQSIRQRFGDSLSSLAPVQSLSLYFTHITVLSNVQGQHWPHTSEHLSRLPAIYSCVPLSPELGTGEERSEQRASVRLGDRNESFKKSQDGQSGGTQRTLKGCGGRWRCN